MKAAMTAASGLLSKPGDKGSVSLCRQLEQRRNNEKRAGCSGQGGDGVKKRTKQPGAENHDPKKTAPSNHARGKHFKRTSHSAEGTIRSMPKKMRGASKKIKKGGITRFGGHPIAN